MEENLKKRQISSEDIQLFIEGHDPQERIVNLEYDYSDDFIKVFYRNEEDKKCCSKQPFMPFVWAKLGACEKLYGGNRTITKAEMLRSNIWCKKLDITNKDGKVCEEMRDGYRFLFYATKAMSYGEFLNFFKRAGCPVYSKNQTAVAKKDSKLFLAVTPQEQYMISTGKRFFKGYEDYNDLLRMIFDLETEGLDPKKDRIKLNGIRLNRPVTINGVTYEDFEEIFRITGNTKEEKDISELNLIDTMLRIIYTFKPDIITAHNGENFDWNFIIERCNQLGTSIEEISKPYFNGKFIYKDKKESILKLGGEIETYHKTIVPGVTITDSLHAVRRAQALDSNMVKADLKYVTEYSNMKKPNRVYTPGQDIDNILIDLEEHYAFNDTDGDWYLYDPNAPNEVTIEIDPTKNLEYFQKEFEINGNSDTRTAEERYNEYIKSIEEANIFKKGKIGNKPYIIHRRNYIADGYTLVSGKYIIERYLKDDLYECDKVEHRYNTSNFLICKMLPVPFSKCCTMGTAGQWKALMLAWSYEQGLAIPPFSESRSFTGGLSRLLSVGYIRDVAKFDYNSLYPSIILTWGISDSKDLMDSMLAFLEYVLTQREKYKGLKKTANKKAEAIKEKLQNHEYKTKEEKEALEQEMLKWKSEESANDKKQLPLKIFGNSFFGSYGAPNLFNWGSTECAERTTCIGRQSLRLMIKKFHDWQYKPIVGDTDGFNFQLPDESAYRYTDENPYISTGLSRETKKDKAYVGFRGDVAEFNDLYMCDKHYGSNCVNKMGLGIDEVVSATINFSRKNYADYFPDEPFPKDVKLVGNTVKSKKMPEYIAKFLEKGVRLLLQGKGQEFLNAYYSYIDKIYNYRIPLKDIASKGKIKKSLHDYIIDCGTRTKSGGKKSRQAWMELALRDNLNVNMGETLYYINTGQKKSESDVKRVTHYWGNAGDDNIKADLKTKLEKEYKNSPNGKLLPESQRPKLDEYVAKYHPEIIIEDEIVLNCRLLPREIVESDTDFYCEDGEEYNVPKYIEQFNKRITPLLVCFSKDIRDKILITNPKDKPYFTKEEAELCSGQPNKEGDQDTYEQLMTMDDKEIKFWLRHPEWKIPFLEECGMDWDKIKNDYLERVEKEKQYGIDRVRTLYEEALNNLTSEDFDAFEEGKLPSSIEKYIMIDAKTNNFVSKDYPDIIIGNIYDIFDAREFLANKMEEEFAAILQ